MEKEEYIKRIKSNLAELEIYFNHKNKEVRIFSKQVIQRLGYSLLEKHYANNYNKTDLEKIKKDNNYLKKNLKQIKELKYF